ncbi:MAG TPA: hypothetical protein VGN54_07870 [Mycobacteriales bacterium]|jgi:hypothetical protein|nr:hypothetical protein [Mycobacteriales bacterium]
MAEAQLIKVLRAIAKSVDEGHPVIEKRLPSLTGLDAESVHVALTRLQIVGMAVPVAAPSAPDATPVETAEGPGWMLLAKGRLALGVH